MLFGPARTADATTLHTTWTAQTTDFDGNNSYTNVGPATGQIPIAGNTWHCFYCSAAVSSSDGTMMRKLECGDGVGLVGTLASCDPRARSPAVRRRAHDVVARVRDDLVRVCKLLSPVTRCVQLFPRSRHSKGDHRCTVAAPIEREPHRSQNEIRRARNDRRDAACAEEPQRTSGQLPSWFDPEARAYWSERRAAKRATTYLGG